MSRPIIKIGFTDYYSPIDEFFVDVLSSEFEIIRDDINPDYLFFCDETFGTNNLNYDPNKTVKVFFTGENRRPWNYVAHHAISFDHFDGPQFYRLPLYAVEEWVFQKKLNLPSIGDSYKNPYRQKIKREKFCSFVVSNPSCTERNEIFHKLSQYKKVDSAGPLYNNTGFILPKGYEGIKQKLDFISDYKFNLCYENGSYPGYVTEKIYHALYSRTIPIYWGSTTLPLDFNPQYVIERRNFSSDEDMISHIKNLDADGELFDFYYNDYFNLYDTIIVPDHNNYIELDLFVEWFMDNVYRGSK